ncbi:MAG: hypothetical protein ACRDD7_11195 [Peptostreptococcaceae bacterium]
MLNLQIDLKIGSVTFTDNKTAKVEILANNKPLSPIYIIKDENGQWKTQNRDHCHTMDLGFDYTYGRQLK